MAYRMKPDRRLPQRLRCAARRAVTEVVLHDELMDTARAVAASIVNNNRAAVQALLASYHRIDEAQTREAFAIEHESAETGCARTPAAPASPRTCLQAVIKRGRSQVR